MTIEIEHLMDETGKILTDALEKIIKIDTLLHFVLGSAGNTTQEALNLLQSGDDEAIQEFIESPLMLTELTLHDRQLNVPTVAMKTKNALRFYNHLPTSLKKKHAPRGQRPTEESFILEEGVSFGNPKCPCIGIDGLSGHVDGIVDGKKVAFPADLGAHCINWDHNTPGCPGQEWCEQKWCYVDPCNCAGLDELPKESAYLPDAEYQGHGIYYSYATCGSPDKYTKKDSKEDREKKIKESCSKKTDATEWGNEDCRCTGMYPVEGKVEVSVGGKEKSYEAQYGSKCNDWDKSQDEKCKSDKPPDYCLEKWCYVNPYKCSRRNQKSAYLPNSTSDGGHAVYYSYDTCGGTDKFAGAKAAEDKKNTDKMNEHYEELEKHMKDFPAQLTHKSKDYSKLGKFEQPTMKRIVKSHAKKVYCGRWAEDSLHLCTAGQEGNVLVTNASTGVIAKMPIKSPFVMQCAYRMDKGLVACGGMNNLVDLWDVKENQPSLKKSFEGHEGYISGLIFLDGGAKLLSGSGDGSAILWDLAKMSMLQQYWGHEADVSGVCTDGPDAACFGTSSTDKTMRIWDMRQSGQKLAVRKFNAKYGVNCCAMMPGSTGIMGGCDNASYEFWSVTCNAQVARGKVKKGRCESICISSSGRVCYTGWDNAFMGVADSYQPESQKSITPENCKDMHSESICSLATAPDGSAICSSSFDKTAKIWGA
jgi:WD40 repeat protein